MRRRQKAKVVFLILFHLLLAMVAVAMCIALSDYKHSIKSNVSSSSQVTESCNINGFEGFSDKNNAAKQVTATTSEVFTPKTQQCAMPIVSVEWSDYYTEREVLMLAALLENESINCTDYEQKVAPLYVVDNRARDESGMFPDTVEEVLLQPGQFMKSYDTYRVKESTVELVKKHLTILSLERRYRSYPAPDRPLPSEYLWYSGDGNINYYRTTSKRTGEYWDWRWSD